MERIQNMVLNNIRNIARLDSYPNHQLRVVNGSSCVPEIIHESRYFSPLCRIVTGDSRLSVLDAIEYNIILLTSMLDTSDGLYQDIYPLLDRFERGINSISQRYENDMNVFTKIEKIMSNWNTLGTSIRTKIDK